MFDGEFETKCDDLARIALDRDDVLTDARAVELARLIQNVIEDYLEALAQRLPVEDGADDGPALPFEEPE